MSSQISIRYSPEYSQKNTSNMTVLICHNVPPALRGAMKRWFIEPQPNIFIGTLNARNQQKVMNYILRNASKEFGMLVIASSPNCQGYTIEHYGVEGKTSRNMTEISGIQLIAEQWVSPDNCPF